ncbi:hypothetical protein BH09VER1_BH09VER1_41460 [soil metagenome]
MRLIALLFIFSAILPFPARAQEKIPTTLAEAHAELEKSLPPKELAKIDAMKSEEDMIVYHMGLGMGIRNSWGLWSGGPLAKYLNGLGFTHPDDMSAVILETFWCKRHGQDFRLQERADEFAAYWKAAKEVHIEEDKRAEKTLSAMKGMMMNLELEENAAPTVRLPDRVDKSIRVRFLAKYGSGVFLTVRKSTGMEDSAFVTEGYFYDPADAKIHKINVPEVREVHSAVAVGGAAWFSGITKGKSVLCGIRGSTRLSVPLPAPGPPPQLGIDGANLLAVYPKSIFRLVDQKWECLYSGEIDLPRSGPPPELFGERLYFRDEGSGENNKRLWWLALNNEPYLTSLDQDMNVIGSSGPRWENSFSHAVSPSGDLWACVGEGYAKQSLLRRTNDGKYSIAIMNNSLSFIPDFFGSKDSDQGLSISGVTLLADGTLLLVGNRGLYCLDGQRLRLMVAFSQSSQDIPVNHGKNIYHWRWDPSDILALGPKSMFISATFGGVYLLQGNEAGKWSIRSLDEKLGADITW